MVYTLQCDSPVGMLTLAERNGALAGLWIEGQKYFFSSLREECQNRPDSPLLLQARRWLDRYFAGERPAAGENKRDFRQRFTYLKQSFNSLFFGIPAKI